MATKSLEMERSSLLASLLVNDKRRSRIWHRELAELIEKCSTWQEFKQSLQNSIDSEKFYVIYYGKKYYVSTMPRMERCAICDSLIRPGEKAVRVAYTSLNERAVICRRCSPLKRYMDFEGVPRKIARTVMSCVFQQGSHYTEGKSSPS